MENRFIKVLAIDDNPDNLIIIRALVNEAFPEGEVLIALSGKEGIELAKIHDPDVILLDIVMPEMDGFEVCRRLKEDKSLSNIPVVIVTALKGDKQSRIHALEAGAEAFLAKPIDESELVAQVRAMVKIKAANVARFDENKRLAALVDERTNELKKTHTATLNLLEDLKQEIEARKKTEEALHKSEELYRSVINASPDNITVTDLGGNILMISPKGLELIGYKSDEKLEGRSINEFLITEHRERALNNISGMFQGVFNGSEEYTLIKSDGSTVDTEINAEFVRGVNGEPTGLVFSIRDITERKQAQDAIRESERKYRLITEKISDVVWIMDLTGKSQFVSQSVEDFTGFTVEEYLSQTINDRFTAQSAQLALNTLQTEVYKYTHEEIISKEYKKILIVEYRCKNGGVKTGEMLITPYFDDENKLIGVHGVTRDITKRQSAEVALRASEEKYRLLVENSPNGIAIYQDGKFVYVNRTGLKIFGSTDENDILGKPVLSIVHPDSIKAVVARMTKVSAGDQVPPLEEKLIRFDGGVFDAEVTALGTTFNGRPAGQVIVNDITDRKLAAEKIKESEEKFRGLADLLPQVIFEMKLTGELTYVNQQATQLFGYEIDELVGQNSMMVHLPEDKERVLNGIKQKLQGVSIDNKEFQMVRKDGSVFPALIVISIIHRDDKPVGIRGVIIDMTDQKKAENLIRESEEKFRDMAELLPQIIFESDVDGYLTYINKQAYKLCGYNEIEESIIGRHATDFYAPVDRDRTIENTNRRLSGAVFGFSEYLMLRKDGTTFPVHVYSNPIYRGNVLVGLRGIIIDVTEQKEANELIQRSEALYRGILEASPDNIIIVGLDARIEMISPASILKYGYTDDANLVGRSLSELVYSDDVDRMLADFTLRANGTKTGPNEYRALRADGSCFDIEVNGGLINDEQGRISKLVFIARDITDRKAAQDALIESESRYNSFINNNIDKIFVKDENCRYLIVNDAMADFFGKDKADIYNRSDKELADTKLIYPCGSSDTRALSADGPFVIEEKLGEKMFETIKFPMKLKNNKTGIGGIMRDITERKLAEERIRYVSRLYAFSSHINKAIVEIKDIDLLLNKVANLAIEYGQFIMCWVGSYDEIAGIIRPVTFAGFDDGYLDGLEINPFDNSHGQGPTGRAFSEKRLVFCNDIATDPIMAAWKVSALKRGYKSSFAAPIFRKGEVSKTLTLYAAEVNFFKDEEQKLIFEISENLSYAIDAIVTEQERSMAEIALKESEGKYRELMENSPEAITIYVVNKVVYINKEALRLMRAKDKSEMMGRSVIDFIHSDNHELVLERMKQVATAPINTIFSPVEEKYIRLDGTEVFVEIRVMPILYDGQPAIQLSGHDITDRKKAELALEQSQSELKTIYDHAPVMMCVVDKNRKIQFANEAFTSLTGVAEDILRGSPVGGVIGCLNSFDEPRGCGYGANCKKCSLRSAMEDTFTNEVEYQNIEYHSTLVVGSERKEVYLLGSTSLIQTSSQKQVLLCLHDITDRKLAEEALHKSEMLLRTFIDNTPFEIWARDIDSVGILENKKLTDHYGSIVGYTPQNDPRIDSDVLRLWEKNNARVFAGEVVDEEYEFMVHNEMRVFQQIVFPININKKIIGIAGFNIDITDRKIAEEKIHENSVKLEMAMQIANMAWWEMNIKTGDILFGRRKTDMLGYKAEYFTHYKHFTEIVHADDFDKMIEAMKHHIYGSGEKYEVEYRIKDVDGNYKWFYDIGSVSKRDVSGKPLVVSGLVLDITERKHAEETLKESQEQLKKFASHLQNVREEERVLLAREIHDQLGQILVAVKIDMGMLKLSVMKNIDKQKSIELLEKFDNLSSLIDNTIRTARKIMTDLRPEVLDMLGFVETVNQHLNGFQERYRMQCTLETHISSLNLTSQQSVALFRIIQEALNNVAKHSKASQVKVVINENNNRLTLQVIDNGVGFDDKNKKKTDSYGLIGMKERVFLLEGELSISSQIGKGTVVKVEVPYKTMDLSK